MLPCHLSKRNIWLHNLSVFRIGEVKGGVDFNPPHPFEWAKCNPLASPYTCKSPDDVLGSNHTGAIYDTSDIKSRFQ
jgi:hypothetical protein